MGHGRAEYLRLLRPSHVRVAQVGISLPHYAAAQWNYGVYVSQDQLQPGDLVFFANLNHVGIYIGNDNYIHDHTDRSTLRASTWLRGTR